MPTLWAALPLVGAIGALLIGRWPALRAAGLGIGLAGLIATLVPEYRRPVERLVEAVGAGVATTLTVVLVIFGGLLLFQVMQRGGAIVRIAGALAGLGAERPALALVIVLGWAPFIESASGFGVAASVTTPLLLALGFPRRAAILIALLGLCAVPWGALGVGTVLGAQLTGQPLAAVGALSALLSLPLFVLYALVAGGLAGGRRAWAQWPLAGLLILTLSGGLWATGRWLSVELAGLVAGLASLSVGTVSLLLGRPSRVAGPSAVLSKGTDGTATKSPSLARALLPYLLLVVVLVLTRATPAITDLLRGWLVLPLPGGGGLPLLINPGLWLAIVALVASGLFGQSLASYGQALLATARQWWRPAAATAGFVALGQLMDGTGMTGQLAGGLAGLGPLAPAAVAPMGALAGFVTGSNAGANAMLARLVVEAALRLDGSPVLALALLNTAAANATMAAPTRVLLALAVAGLTAAERPGEEVAVTRCMLMVVAVAVLGLGLLGVALASLGGA